jgi:hypothetical protein
MRDASPHRDTPSPPRWTPRGSAQPAAPTIDPVRPRRDRERVPGEPRPPRRRVPVADERSAAPAAASPPHHHRWVVTLSIVGVLVLLAACGLGAYFMVRDDGAETARRAQASARPSAVPRDISSREVDPAPLTEQEVFPQQTTLTVAGNDQPYQILKTQATTDCRIGAADDLGNLLVQLGCSQVVRGTLKSADGKYVMTAGIFNLKDEASAAQADQAIKPTVDAQKGRFTPLLAGTATDALVRAPSHLAWFVRGHFLAYALIARADSTAIAADDPAPATIATDLVETHLRDTVIGARAVQPTASAKPSAKQS